MLLAPDDPGLRALTRGGAADARGAARARRRVARAARLAAPAPSSRCRCSRTAGWWGSCCWAPRRAASASSAEEIELAEASGEPGGDRFRECAAVRVGDLRRTDRPLPPRGGARDSRPRVEPLHPLRPPAVDRPRRPRPLQVDQRPPRPPGRRPGAAARRGGAPRAGARHRLHRALRRRGVPDRAARDRSSTARRAWPRRSASASKRSRSRSTAASRSRSPSRSESPAAPR